MSRDEMRREKKRREEDWITTRLIAVYSRPDVRDVSIALPKERRKF